MKNKAVLYDNIGVGYNATRQADPQIAQKLFEFLEPAANGTYMDVGCGTGNYTIALANKGLNFFGIEPSDTMVDTAKRRSSKISWLSGSAEQIPLENESVDGALATLTIHHWEDIKKAFTEICRVLKPGARFVIFTADPEQLKCYWLSRYFPKMMDAVVLQMPSFELIKEAAFSAGITITKTEKYFIDNDLKDLFLYAGKNQPEIYLDEQVRAGISSFAVLAENDELTKGLSELTNDIKSQCFNDVKNMFDDAQGDYLFIIAEKSRR